MGIGGMKMGFVVDGKIQELEVTSDIMTAAMIVVARAMAFYKKVEDTSAPDETIDGRLTCTEPTDATELMHACHKFEKVLNEAIAGKLGTDPAHMEMVPDTTIVGQGKLPDTMEEAMKRGFTPNKKISKHDLN